jgi:hypothetical protein
LRGGQRAAAAMSLIQSAKLNGHDPYQYLKDVLQRLPTHPASRIEELLPHRWRSPATVHWSGSGTRAESGAAPDGAQPSPAVAEDAMTDLLEAMRECKTVQDCIELALTDAYGDDEQAVAWLTASKRCSGIPSASNSWEPR